MKRLECLTLGVALMLLFLMSCERKVDEPTAPVASVAVVDTAHKGAGISLSVKPLLRDQYCPDGRYAVYLTYWELEDTFRVVSGKYVGVGGDGNMSRMQNYISQYQFNLALAGGGPQVISTINSLAQMGYSKSNIIISLDSSSWQQTVDDAIDLTVNRFYIDEPIRHSHQLFVQMIVPYIAGKGGTLTISESEFRWYDWYQYGLRGNIGAMIDLAFSCSPSPYVSCHTHFDNQHPPPAGVLIDPRDQWTYIMGRAPWLFKMAWIKTRQDLGEMEELFGHANNLGGPNQILFYPFADDGVTYVGRFDLATQAGKNEGWLQQFEKQYTQQWCCPTPNYDPGVCTLYTWWYTGVTAWF
jgi:hypothetical protein